MRHGQRMALARGRYKGDHEIMEVSPVVISELRLLIGELTALQARVAELGRMVSGSHPEPAAPSSFEPIQVSTYYPPGVVPPSPPPVVTPRQCQYCHAFEK